MGVIGLSELLTRLQPIQPWADRHDMFIGLLLPLMSIGAGERRTVDEVLRIARSAAARAEVQVYFDWYGRCCGYVIWARVAADREQGVLACGPEDWNEECVAADGEVWVIEFKAWYAQTEAILGEFVARLPMEFKHVSYFRRQKGRWIAKRVSRRELLSRYRRALRREQGGEPFLFSENGVGYCHYTRQCLEDACKIGKIICLLEQITDWKNMPVALALRRIRYPVRKQQYSLFLSTSGEALGYYSWAWRELGECERFATTPLSVWDLADWNDGRDLFLCDAVAREDGIERVMEDLQSVVFPFETLFVWRQAGIASGVLMRAFPWEGGGRQFSRSFETTPGARDMVAALLDRA